LLELYLKSNPNYARKEEHKEEEPAVVEKVVKVVDEAQIEQSLKLVGFAMLNHTMKQKQRLSVGTQAENAAFDELMASTFDVTQVDSDKWDKKEWLHKLDSWTKLMTKYSVGSKDHAHDNVSYEHMAH